MTDPRHYSATFDDMIMTVTEHKKLMKEARAKVPKRKLPSDITDTSLTANEKFIAAEYWNACIDAMLNKEG